MPRWKSGQPSPNPNGRPKLPEDLKHARAMNRQDVERLLSELIHLPPEELAERKRAPKSMLELFVIAIITQGINKGDQMRLNFLLENVYGKVSDKLEVTNPYMNKSLAELEALVKEKLGVK